MMKDESEGRCPKDFREMIESQIKNRIWVDPRSLDIVYRAQAHENHDEESQYRANKLKCFGVFDIAKRKIS